MTTSKKNHGDPNGLITVEAKSLSNLEEIIYRCHCGVSLDEQAPLKKKSTNKAILARLLELERKIIERAHAKGLS
jgi:hypothetical protein